MEADLLDMVLKLGKVHLPGMGVLLLVQSIALLQDMAAKQQKLAGTEHHWSGMGQHSLGRVPQGDMKM